MPDYEWLPEKSPTTDNLPPVLAFPSPGQDLELLTAQETGALLKVDAATVYRMIQRGELLPVRFGRCVRVARTDLAAFIANHRSASQ